MDPIRIIEAGLWTALMLIYLLGDVIRIFSGDFEPGKMDGKEGTRAMWMAASVIMLIPIAMLILNLTLMFPAIRIVNIVAAIGIAIFNLMGLPYKGAYDNFLIIVSIIVNGITVFYAWRWNPL